MSENHKQNGWSRRPASEPQSSFPGGDAAFAARAYLAKNVLRVFRLWRGWMIELPRPRGA